MSEEILNYLENDKNYSVDCNDGSYYLELPYKEAHEIKDLITNLQQENKQLKKENKELNKVCELYGQSLYNADLTKMKSILTELEEYYKEQLEFIIELPAYTKDIAQEHKVMELCYEDFLNKIQGLKEKYK